MENRQELQEEALGRESKEDASQSRRRSPVFRGEDPDGRRNPAPVMDDDLTADEASTPEAESFAEDRRDSLSFPERPRTSAEVGLSEAFLADLMLKVIHYSGNPSQDQLMRKLGLGRTIVEKIARSLQENRFCEAMTQSDLYAGSFRYRLANRGEARVTEALERTRYAGPAPVTLAQYVRVVQAQQAYRQKPSRESIEAVLNEFVFPPEVADTLARALTSGRTTILYGPSGSGKTTIIERAAKDQPGAVLIPYAIYAMGQVIRVFDPGVHEALNGSDERQVLEDGRPLDRRWVLVRPPAIKMGLETGPEALEPAYDPQTRFYQAPPHMKAQGGVLVLDDLGRDTEKPKEVLSRWLIAEERGWDSLGFATGEKVTIPLDVQLLLATDQPLHRLVDDSRLRRILYKIEIPSPGPREFARILIRLCTRRNVQTPEGATEGVVRKLYGESDERPRASDARDLIEFVIEGAFYERRNPVLDEESFETAFKLLRSQRRAGDTT